MEFRILGPVQVWAAGRGFPVGEPRQHAVLAALLVNVGRPVTMDTLVDRVWGDSPPPQARRSLQAHLAKIRRVLHTAADAETREATSRPVPQPLVRSAGGYMIAARVAQVDALRFRELVAQCRPAAVDERLRASRLREALRLWRGEPLAGVSGTWAARMRQTWRQEHIDATEMWARAEIQLGNASAVLGPLTDLAEEHPTLETAAATLMWGLYAAGRPSDALDRYEKTRRCLRDQLGADPGPELRAWYQAVLQHDTTMLAGGSERPVGPVPAQLPFDVSAFTGRVGEMAELDRLLDESPLLCVTGTAGVGKTALAVRWAHQVRDRFPDGQLYLNLRGYDPSQPTNPADALATLLKVLAPADPPIPLDLEERAARYRSAIAGRRMLIVLDNAATAEQVRPLLPGAAGCVVLVTSRDSLAGLVSLHGARRVGLDLLPQSDAVALLRRLVGPRIDDETTVAAALADLCARLPLALRVAAELAVSRPAAPLSDLVWELRPRGRFDLLSADGDQPAAVRAVFSWSLRHLSAAAARTFVLLGLHPGAQFDSYAAAALIGGDPDGASRVLDMLTRAHLIHEVGYDRFGIHDLLRSYATGLATAPASGGRPADADAAATRLFDYYLTTATGAMGSLHPGEAGRWPATPAPDTPMPDLAEPAAARRWLDTEMDNLLAVTAHAGPAYAIRLSTVLHRYLDGGHDAASITIHRRARDAARHTGDLGAEAHALTALGAAHAQAGRHRVATEDLCSALALFRQVGDPMGQARALGNLGTVAERLGRYYPATEHYQRAATLYRQAADVIGEAHALTRLGAVQARLGRTAAATEHLQRALGLHRRAGHRFGEAWALTGIGDVEARAGRPATAAERHHEALTLFRHLGHRTSEAWTLDGLGSSEALLGRHSEAADHYRQALALFRELGERAGEASSLNGLGETDAAAGRPADARVHHAAALAVAEDTGALDQQARAHTGLARAYRDTADLDTARAHYQRASAIYTELGMADAGAIGTELATLDNPTPADPAWRAYRDPSGSSRSTRCATLNRSPSTTRTMGSPRRVPCEDRFRGRGGR
jgi:DNA-binding SARP family transcriptional activator/tetratricopeptide (TPR) repeat protein